MREFHLSIERDAEGEFIASIPELRGPHSQAKSLGALMNRIKDAVELCREVERGKPEAYEFVGVQKMAV